jgi:hypothetical protein
LPFDVSLLTFDFIFDLCLLSRTTDPSPGPLRLVKAPAAGHPLPKGEGGFHNFTAVEK